MAARGASDRLRLLVVTQYYHPEVGAPQTRLRETIAGLRDRGFDVTVVAPVPSYPLGRVPLPYRWWRPARESIGGTSVVRLPALVAPGAGMSRRMVGHGSFALTSLAGCALAPRADIALIESPPLLLAFAARALRALGVPYVFHVADPWPDFPIAMGYLQTRLERRAAFALEDFAYRGASAITTVSPGLVELLSAKPSAAGRVELLPNAVDLDAFDPGQDRREARRRLGWADGFTVVYVGTVGLAQGVGTLLDAARSIDERATIRIVGNGVEKAALEERAAVLGLRNVVFHPSIDHAHVPLVLAAADASLVMLRKGPLFADSLPTKLLEAMAAGRPVVVVADGLAARIVLDANAGYVAPAEDAAALARAIDACRIDPGRDTRGRNGRAHVASHYDRRAIVDRLAEIIRRAAHAAGRPG